MKIPLLVVSFATLSLLWVSGCATQADLQGAQKDQDVLRAQVADQNTSVAEVRREIERIRGQVEEVQNRLDRLARERGGASSRVKTLEERIAALENQLATQQTAVSSPPAPAPSLPPAPPGAPVTLLPPAAESPVLEPPGVAPVPPPLLPSTQDEIALAKEPPEVQDEYRIALQALNDRQYDRAIQLFRTFQRKNPNSPMADDAQFWIGESYFNRKDYNRAILEFNDVLKYRRGDKVPAALFRQARAFVEIGDKTDARLILQKLVNDHPSSEQAKEAREMLQTLGR